MAKKLGNLSSTRAVRRPAQPRPAEAVLETVPNPHPGTLYLVRFTQPEFTSSARSRASPTSHIW